MKILVIDNFDSFTYNLVQYLGALGADVAVRRSDATLAALEGERPDALVVSPGPCTPREAGVSVEAIRAFAGRIPILGVCLGHQCIAAAFGGRIVRAPTLMHGKTSEVRHDGRTIYEGLPNPLTATRYHSLCVDPASIPPDLEATAWTDRPGAGKKAPSGDRARRGVVMGLRHKNLPIEGVQFHPESILTTDGKRLLGNFLRLAAGRVRR